MVHLNKSIEILKKYWGFDSFRPLQQNIIDAVSNKKDVLALLPTGGGKSICFQVPALMNEGICIVVSPLIALMKDQVENLKNKGINALLIHSGMSFIEVKRTLQNAAFGNYKFLYVSPERLQTDLFEEFLPAIKPTLIAIDEAHCISQWGYDFRPSYLNIANLRNQLPDVPIIALTASATLDVQKDICEKLSFRKNAEVFQQSFDRPNLSYSVVQPASKHNELINILKKTSGSSIVYCKSRKQTQEISILLNQHQLEADFYHAGLSNDERNSKQENWINNRKRIIVCTNAFGMGIDKPDVRLVTHFNLPESLENYYQEAGRAGRDGKSASAILLVDQKEQTELKEINQLRYPSIVVLKKLYQDIMNYFQVPAGIGENQIFNFDLAEFCERFKWKTLQANYGLQALAQEEILSYTESSNKAASLVFTSTKEQIFDFETRAPQFEGIIKGLLRTYPGIFDFPVSIYETALAKFISTPVNEVKKQLEQLNQYGIVEYKPQNNKPQIILLQNRMYRDDFKFNEKGLEERKEKHINRINAIIDYCVNRNECRSKIIGNYFNDMSIAECGKCDNCISKKNKADKSNVVIILPKIKDALKSGIKTKPEIQKLLSEHNNNDINLALKYLESENMISVNENGIIKLN